MALSRRNILVGLGALVGGGGALVSTGAFSTVSAQRDVSVNTTGDSSALVAFNATDQGEEYISGVSGGELDINLGGPSSNGFNQNAITTIGSLFQITNNSAEEEDIDVGFNTDDPATGQSGKQVTQLRLPSSGTADSVVTLAVVDGSNSLSSVSDITLNDDGSVSGTYGSSVSVSSGSSVPVGVIVDTRTTAIDNGNIDQQDGITIVAEGTTQ
jgi:hypothetical protein